MDDDERDEKYLARWTRGDEPSQRTPWGTVSSVWERWAEKNIVIMALHPFAGKPTSATALYEAYLNERIQNGWQPLTVTNFGRLLGEMGVTKKKTQKGMVYTP